MSELSTGRTGYKYLVASLVVAVVASACGTPSSSTPEGPVADTSTLIVGLDTLGNQQWAPKLAYNENQYTTHLLAEGLTWMNPDTGEVEGLLAESYEASPDGKTWTITLRQNIPFHDGYGNVTSDDVKYSFEQYLDKDAFYSSRELVGQAVDFDMKNFEIVNDHVFKLHASEPVVELPANGLCMCSDGPVIYSHRYAEEKPGAEETHPIGTGPFKFVSSTPGTEVVLEAVPNHWRQTPGFKKLILREIPDPGARLVQTQSGALDIALLSAGLVSEARGTEGLRVITTPDASNVYIAFGGNFWGQPELDADSPWIQAANPEKGLAIREAMSLAIDRKTILDRVLFGEGTLAYTPLFGNPNIKSQVDPSWKLPEYNLDLARQKLAEGGYPNGFPVEFPIFDQKLGTAPVGEAVAGMWEKLGLQVNRRPIDEAAWDPRVDTRDTAGAVWIHARGSVTIVGAIDTLSSTRTDAKWTDPVIDDFATKMSEEPDQAAREKLGRELGTYVRDNMLGIPLFMMNFPWVVGPKVGDWKPIPTRDQISNLESATPATVPAK